MTMDQVADWALSRGFAWESERVLAAPYKEATVRIELLARNLRVSIAAPDGRTLKIASPHPSRLHVNQHGVLEGAGLSASFAQRLRSRADAPPWFTESYCDAVLGHLERGAGGLAPRL